MKIFKKMLVSLIVAIIVLIAAPLMNGFVDLELPFLDLGIKASAETYSGSCGNTNTEGISIEHNYESVVTAPTCTEAGYTTFTCSVCGDIYTDDLVPATGHLYDIIVDSSLYPESAHEYANNSYETQTFTYEGATELKITFSMSTKVELNHDYIYIYDGRANLIGKYTSTTLAGKTLTIPGDTFKIELRSDSNETYYGYSFTSIIATSRWTVTTNPECETVGEKSLICFTCGATETAEIPATGHLYDIVVDSSLYPESSHYYSNNTNQTKTFTYEGAKQLEITFSMSTKVELDHDYIYIYDGRANLIGTYTSTTLAGKTLTIPGDTFKIKLTSDSNETYYGYSFTSIIANSWKVTTNPECETVGEKSLICFTCGATETAEIPATGHLYDIVVDSSLYPESPHNYYIPINQTKIFTYEGANQLEITFSISTEVESNNDYIYIYDGSDNLIGKYTGTTLAGKTLTIPGDTFKIKLTSDDVHYFRYYGYSFTSIIANSWKVTTNPECETVGEKSLICFTCGATETAEIPELGHNYTSTVTAPTCTEQGYTTYTCECGDSYKVDYVDAIDHDFGVLVDSSQYPQSAHNYADDLDETKTFTYEGASKLEITFSSLTEVEKDCDYIYVYDGSDNLIGKYTGTALASKILTITGDTLKIRLTSNSSNSYYGYSFDSIVTDNWTITTAPGCETVGEKTVACLNCSELGSIKVEVPATGHTCSDWTIATPPGCETIGKKLLICITCGATTETAEIPATGHTYDSGVVTTAPTCTEVGVKIYTCEDCGHTYTTELSALGHNHSCDIDKSEYPESSHEYANNSDEIQTFTYEGATQLKITFSSETYVESGFDYIYVYDGSDNLIGQYTGNELAGKTLTISDDTIKIKLTSNASYTYYGYSLTSINVTCDWVIVNKNDCVNDGEKTRRCTVCGIIRENIAATGHLYDIAVDSSLYPESSHSYSNNISQTKTFTQDGATQLKITFSASTKVESGYDYIYVYDGSDNLIGKYTGTTLAGQTLTIPGDTFKIKLTSDSSQTYYGYSFTSITANTWTVTTNPGCETVGEKSHICTTCGKATETTEIPATGHSYSDWTITTPPGCETIGEKSLICATCGKTTEVAEIPATGHNFGKWCTAKASTCTETGEEKRICTKCGVYETKETSKKPHSYKPVVTLPTCTSGGYITYTCSACNESYNDNYVNATGHNFGEWSTNKTATCTETGEEKRVCSDCDLYETREIPEILHSYNPVVTPPTCTSGGYTTYTCISCNSNYNADHVNAKGHSYNNGVCTSCGDDKTASCSCNCHKGGISKIIFNIILIFQKIFKTNKVCSCGMNHY